MFPSLLSTWKEDQGTWKQGLLEDKGHRNSVLYIQGQQAAFGGAFEVEKVLKGRLSEMQPLKWDPGANYMVGDIKNIFNATFSRMNPLTSLTLCDQFLSVYLWGAQHKDPKLRHGADMLMQVKIKFTMYFKHMQRQRDKIFPVDII